MKKKIVGLFILSFTIILSGCSQWIDRGESVTAVGSSALQPLVETVAEEFQQDQPGKFVNVQGGGSGTGLSQVQNGSVDIGNSDMFAEEKSGVDASELVDHRVAVIGITPVVNKEVGVEELSKEELKQIFLGDITNWQEVGGNDQEIVILNRATGSGTRDTFEKWVLDDENAISSQEQESSGMVRQIVSDTPGAISYLAFSYVTEDVDVLAMDGVEPTDENVKTNNWPIWSYEHMYTRGEPTGLTKEFMDYILSDGVQEELVGQLGYIPVSQMEVERDANGDIVE
ncbi:MULTISPECIES: phosphate ABC transporter substrate-binding protein PstS [Tetragenococcus]|uniref:Phosphate-binding protein n=3 Tax=Tetragenococcus TaxID=51668 RepID=A0A091CCI5_9ENTE|nr:MULTISPECIES: phosphate ABC transporter substrate-binding protein PstS [Tetragenococcus]GMA46799.1 phosphate ABC transporter ATP-binding protein [Tetragenococcus muriaticus]GMA54943.1 phosphate ABC transporter ATP-binding protein [Alicyclobacillus contaminans]AYW46916.1 phosphate ABC transporter substrate-binding protein [Tetragenococcus osmophilus]KFN90393.1 periplasmic substrate-binding component of an ABC superfamily phosphate transporter [Tetragenococcus muriaticus 3MR10-3]KFN90797.1 pe